MPDSAICVLIEEPGSWPASASALEETVRRAASAALEAAAPPGTETGAVCVRLTGAGPVRLLNRRWRGKDAATNVLSFPAARGAPAPPGELPPLGDLALAGPVVASEAQAADVPLTEHLAGLVVHGILHLLGYDHSDPAEAARMEEAERRIMARLGLPDPYAGEEETETS